VVGGFGVKGFVFAVFFLAFFTLFLGVSVFYALAVAEGDRIVLDARRAEKASLAADDVAWDLKSFFGIRGLELAKNSSNSSVTISSTIPSNLSNPEAELNAYKQFLQATYSRKTHSNTSLDGVGNHVFFTGLNANYSWNNESRNAVAMAGGNAFAYSVSGRMNYYCTNPGCAANVTTWAWVACGANALNVLLDIRDANSTQVTVSGTTSGCVSKTTDNEFFIPTNGGTLYVNAGNVSGSSPALKLNATQALFFSFTLSTNFSTAPEIRAVVPATLSVDGHNYSQLVLGEK